MITHIIFDLGNVLIEIYPGRTISALSDYCKLPCETLQHFFLSEIHLQFMGGELTPVEFHQSFKKHYSRDITYEQFVDAWAKLIGPAKNGIPEMVESLSARYDLAVCSNTDPLHWQLARSKDLFFSYFKNFFLSFELNCNKPSPDIFGIILNKLSVSPSNVIFIDDTPANINIAKQLDFKTLHATNAAQIIQGLIHYNIYL